MLVLYISTFLGCSTLYTLVEKSFSCVLLVFARLWLENEAKKYKNKGYFLKAGQLKNACRAP